MHIEIDQQWRVHASGSVDLPLSASAVWGQMRDYRELIGIDPLHASVRLDQRWPPIGARLIISHRFLGLGPDRVGRMLRWREGCGFVFSDLSRRGLRVGFPHVCAYEVEFIDNQSCRLMVWTRGRWTARWIPKWLVRFWLWWVIAGTEQRVRAHFMHFARWRRRRRQHYRG